MNRYFIPFFICTWVISSGLPAWAGQPNSPPASDWMPYMSLALTLVTTLIIPLGAFLYRSLLAKQSEIVSQINAASASSDRHTEHHVASLKLQIDNLSRVLHRETETLSARLVIVEQRQVAHERDYMPRTEVSEHLRDLKTAHTRLADTMDAGFKHLLEKIP